MSTIALIGPDGSGKTSVAKQLLRTSQLPLKYVYMGTSIESSNIALPTSRLIHRVKVMQVRREMRHRGEDPTKGVTLHGVEHRRDRRGKVGACLRLLRRVSEEMYRQLWSWGYQLGGKVVLYDRHFLFDSLPDPSRHISERRLTDRIHDWFLRRLYPRPDLTILLTASADVLYARKQEVPIEYLEADTDALRSKRIYVKNFIEVDADQPFDLVVATIEALIATHLDFGRSSGR